MTKAGVVKAKFPRRPRSGWSLKRITVERTKSGKYFCDILFECAAREPEPVLPTPETTLGLKYSVSRFYVTDQGATADPPNWLRDAQEKLARIQRRLARMKPGSKNYQEMVRKFRELHEHTANQRRDWLHKESRRIANAWDAVCVRDDDLTSISKLPNCGSAMASGFGEFRKMLRYKLERQGKQFIPVSRNVPTSRICHRCGCLHDGSFCSRRTWVCPSCGAVLNREQNAAQNIKDYGLMRGSA